MKDVPLEDIINNPSSFISHMVQMKVRQLIFINVIRHTLYPTWFRWKLKNEAEGQCLRFFALYPTWFRWKSLTTSSVRPFLSFFISHMVQMKVLFKKKIMTLILTLYPTWFRWKSGSGRGKDLQCSTLYPTWFRWKRLDKTTIQTESSLYIPHGSDESIGYGEL